MMMAMNAVTSIQCSQLKEINIVYTDNSLSVLVFLSGDQTRPGEGVGADVLRLRSPINDFVPTPLFC